MVFGVGDFKYATQNFKGAKGVAMATKFGQKKPKLNKTPCLDRIVRRRNVVNGSEDVFLWILVSICGLIKKQFQLFFEKIDKIAYTYNSKDAKHSNRNNFICVQDIDTTFACIIGFRVGEFKYAI